MPHRDGDLREHGDSTRTGTGDHRVRFWHRFPIVLRCASRKDAQNATEEREGKYILGAPRNGLGLFVNSDAAYQWRDITSSARVGTKKTVSNKAGDPSGQAEAKETLKTKAIDKKHRRSQPKQKLCKAFIGSAQKTYDAHAGRYGPQLGPT